MLKETTCILPKNIEIEDILHSICSEYGKCELDRLSNGDIYFLCFEDKNNEYKEMIISFKNECEAYYGIEGVLCFMSEGADIMTYLCACFNGYICYDSFNVNFKRLEE